MAEARRARIERVGRREARSLAGESFEQREFRQQVEAVLEARQREMQGAELSSRSPVTTEAARGSGFAMDDFTRYMLNSAERAEILGHFESVVRPLLEAGKTVHIISHSWGTVVAWEGLRQLEARNLPGRVANLFLVGSALSIPPVRSNLFARIGDGRRPSLAQQVINLDAAGDIVGGHVSDSFDVSDEFLGLKPVGCSTIPFTDTALNPACAHSSYFEASNVAVNRDIFARFING